jgi:hypothetical protein
MKYRVEIVDEPKYEVMIEDLPKAKVGAQVNYSLFNKLAAMGGADMNMSAPESKATKTITRVPREAANLEAEGGETVLTFDPSGYPLFYTIKGPRHHSGGVPLNLPDDSFIFSDTKDMIIRDCTILKMFNKPCNKKGYTPAALSKQFDINGYRNTLQDPNTDEITRRTAESMIKKYVIKLGALALAQEAKKGFPQGIPVVAKPYMEAYGISEGDIMPELAEQEQQMPQQDQGQMSPTDQMPPDQYAQEPQPEGAQYTQGEEMGQQQQQGTPAPEGMATPDMVEPMMQQMEQQGPPPMAMYGMSMGGFYPEFAFGGMPMYPGGGITVNSSSSSAPITDSKRLGQEYGKGTYKPGTAQSGQTYYDVEGQPKVKGRGWTEGTDVAWSYTGGGGGSWNPTVQQAVDQYCKNMKNPKSKLFYGVAAEVIAEKNFGWMKKKDPAQYATILEKLKGCKAGGAQEKFEFVTNETPEEDCPVCKDKNGNAITTGPDGQPFVRVKGPDGNCTPCPTEGCFCKDENGNEIEVECGTPCTKEEEVYRGESTSGGAEVPFKSNPDYLFFADANMNPEFIGPRGTQLEMYGIDPRSKANMAQAASNAIGQAQSKFASNPGALTANLLAGQAASADIVNQAFDQANKFNTEVRNEEIKTNTAYRKDFLDKFPVYAQDYLGKVARKKENDARFFNEKAAKRYEMKQAQKKYDTEMQWLQASNENVKWDPNRGFYSVKTRDFTPTQPNSDMLARTKQVMGEGIEDENVAYKIAKDMMSRYGGPIYVNGGFVYTDNIFPFLI